LPRINRTGFSIRTTLCAATLGACTLAAGSLPVFAAGMEHADGVKARPELDAKIAETLAQCADISPSCGDVAAGSAAVLVFPDVTTVNLGIGGEGGEGAMIEGDKIVGYYDIGKASAGLQIGAKQASQVYAIPTQKDVKDLTDGGEWQVGSGADITVMTAHATVEAQSDQTRVYVFDSKGLNGGANVSALRIWKDDAKS